MQYSHYIVGLLPNDANPQNNPLTYDSWLFKDIKTWNGAYRRAYKYAEAHKNSNMRPNMRPVLFAYTSNVLDGHTPPARWTYL